MSNFLAGFAGEGLKQLDAYTSNKREDEKLAKLRKYQEERYAIERGDRKADSIESINREQAFKEADDFKGIYVTNGAFMRNTKSVDADGNIVITPAQVKDPYLIATFKAAEAKRLRDEKNTELDTEVKINNVAQERFNTATMGEKWSLEKADKLASIAASGRSGREKADNIPMPDHVDAIGKSLAKNKDVFFRSEKDHAAFKKLLAKYGFKDGADLGRRYERKEEKAIFALDEGAEYLYFPSATELDAATGKLKQIQ